MENKIEIKTMATVEEIANIIRNNDPEEVAKAMEREILSLCLINAESFQKKRDAEKALDTVSNELHRITKILADAYLAQLTTK